MAFRKAKNARYHRRQAAEHAQVFLPEPSMELLVRRVAARGATDDDFECMYGLAEGTVQRWKKHYKGFAKALEEGRTKADGDVLYALYRNAVGYHQTEEQAVGGRNPCVLDVKRYYPGQFSAQKYWLNNRDPERWKSRERVDHAGVQNEPIGVKVEDRNELIDQILEMVQSKPDGEKVKPKQSDERAR